MKWLALALLVALFAPFVRLTTHPPTPRRPMLVARQLPAIVVPE